MKCKNSGSQSEELRRDSGTLKFSKPVSPVKEETKHTPETLEVAKELIAKSNGFKSWEEIQSTWLERTGQVLVVHENYVDQMHELVSESKADLLKENQELQKELANTQINLSTVEALNAEMLEALEKAQRAIQQAATESYREEIQRYLSGGYTEMIQAACFKDSLGIDSAINKAKGI